MPSVMPTSSSLLGGPAPPPAINLSSEGSQIYAGPPPPPVVGLMMLEQPVDEDSMFFNELPLQEEEEGEPYHLMNNSNHNGYLATGSSHLSSGTGRVSWEYKSVSLTRVPGYGFGIAVSGGCDNPHFANGDPAIAISDVLKGGPAEGKLLVNDRIITANGVKLEKVDYGTAVQVLRDSGPTVNLIIKRRTRLLNAQNAQKVCLPKLTSAKVKNIQPNDYGLNLLVKVFVKEFKHGSGSGASVEAGDEIFSVNGVPVDKLFDFKRAFQDGGGGGSKLILTIVKSQANGNNIIYSDGQGQHGQNNHQHNHQTQPSYESSNGNLYVQPPTRNIKAPPSQNSDLPPPPPPLRPPLPKESDLYGLRSSQQQQPPPIPPPNQLHHPMSPPPPVHNNISDGQTSLIQASSQPGGQPAPPARYINFIKRKNQLGIRLSGGNHVGIYISAVQADTGADQGGLRRGDRILRVNDTEYNNNVTREEAIEKLTLLKNESIVSLIVRHVPEFEKILQENEFHDKVYYRIRFNFLNLKRNSILVVSDSLCQGAVQQQGSGSGSGQYGWEGYQVESRSGKILKNKISLPNFKQAKELAASSSSSGELTRTGGRGTSFRRHHQNSVAVVATDMEQLYSVVKRRKVTWPRPVVIYSNFSDVINERLVTRFPNRFAIVQSTIVSEMESELRGLMEKGLHGVLQIKSVATFDQLMNNTSLCPVAIVVKAEKQLLRDILKSNNNNNKNNNYYTSLLRSFNKSGGGGMSKKCSELEKTEDELGESCRVVQLTSDTKQWLDVILQAIELELRVQLVWANLPSCDQQQQQETSDEEEGGDDAQKQQQQRTKTNTKAIVGEVPNYNIPPPYALHPNGNSSFVSLTNHLPAQHQMVPPPTTESFYQQRHHQSSSATRGGGAAREYSLVGGGGGAAAGTREYSLVPGGGSGGRPYSTESLTYPTTTINRPISVEEHTPLLAHSPVNLPMNRDQQGDLPNPWPITGGGGILPAAANAPQIDRTKKPSRIQQQQQQVYQTIPVVIKQKPIPPPKPKIPFTRPPIMDQQQDYNDYQDDKQSYYLNLPINSKAFNAPTTGGGTDHRGNKKSAFELYRKPILLQQQQHELYPNNNSSSYLPPPPPTAHPPANPHHHHIPVSSKAHHQNPYQQQKLPLEENVTTGTFDSSGGVLKERLTNNNQIPIELRIPEGAIPDGSAQTIWFHTVPNPNPPDLQHLDLINGNGGGGGMMKDKESYLISPLIKFGPEGLRFNKPVEIRLPQYSRQCDKASVLLNSNANWSKINIQQQQQQDNLPNSAADADNNVKIVSLTIQQF